MADARCGLSSLDEVLRTPVKVDEMHHLLFAIESFERDLRGDANDGRANRPRLAS